MAEISSKTYNEQLLEIRDLYQAAGQPWPATARDIAAWAIKNGHYRAHRAKLISFAADEFAAAMREVVYTDPQGRSVRVLHVARMGKGSAQKMLWNDIRTAPREHMEKAFQLRRRSIVGDCKHLKNDVDSYNDNHLDEMPIQLVLDFALDVEEGNTPVAAAIKAQPKKVKPR